MSTPATPQDIRDELERVRHRLVSDKGRYPGLNARRVETRGVYDKMRAAIGTASPTRAERMALDFLLAESVRLADALAACNAAIRRDETRRDLLKAQLKTMENAQ